MIIKILLDECLPKKLKYRIEELNLTSSPRRYLKWVGPAFRMGY